VDGDFWPGPCQMGGQRLKVNTRPLKRAATIETERE
jgi:hypothetical protein